MDRDVLATPERKCVFVVILSFLMVATGRSGPQQRPLPFSPALHAQASSTNGSASGLVRIQTIATPSELAQSFFSPERCDSEGNLYLPKEIVDTPVIHKLNPKGETVASFDPGSNPGVNVNIAPWYTVERKGGNLYQLVIPHGPDQYVYAYKSDGTFRSAVKLEAGFRFHANKLAVFPNGEFLISGDKYGNDHKVDRPFTGIFAAEGQLTKELELEDDKTLNDIATVDDNRFVYPDAPQSNMALNFGSL